MGLSAEPQEGGKLWDLKRHCQVAFHPEPETLCPMSYVLNFLNLDTLRNASALQGINPGPHVCAVCNRGLGVAKLKPSSRMKVST